MKLTICTVIPRRRHPLICADEQKSLPRPGSRSSRNLEVEDQQKLRQRKQNYPPFRHTFKVKRFSTLLTFNKQPITWFQMHRFQRLQHKSTNLPLHLCKQRVPDTLGTGSRRRRDGVLSLRLLPSSSWVHGRQGLNSQNFQRRAARHKHANNSRKLSAVELNYPRKQSELWVFADEVWRRWKKLLRTKTRKLVGEESGLRHVGQVIWTTPAVMRLTLRADFCFLTLQSNLLLNRTLSTLEVLCI